MAGSQGLKILNSAGRSFIFKGFDIVRIHPIDHGDSEHLNEDFFRATDIQALIEVVKYLGQKFSDNEIHLIGFSLGGNISLRISASPEINFLKKTIVLSPVINPENSMNAMDKNSWILRKYFIDKWKKTIRRKIDLYNINAKEALKHKILKVSRSILLRTLLHIHM